MGIPANRPRGPWWGQFRERLKLERQVRDSYPEIVGKHIHEAGRRGFLYTLSVEVPHYADRRRVEIFFPTRVSRSLKISVDGPEESPHRYDDNTLCIWFTRDKLDCQWLFDDGLRDLIDLIVVHLFKEEWWRETGEWLGDQVGHGSGGKGSSDVFVA